MEMPSKEALYYSMRRVSLLIIAATLIGLLISNSTVLKQTAMLLQADGNDDSYDAFSAGLCFPIRKYALPLPNYFQRGTEQMVLHHREIDYESKVGLFRRSG